MDFFFFLFSYKVITKNMKKLIEIPKIRDEIFYGFLIYIEEVLFFFQI